MPRVHGYLITWSTYGSFLHGDARGAVDRSGEHGPGRPRQQPDTGREHFERSELAGPAMVLDGPKREVVEQTIRAHAAYRAWSVLALHVRARHLHLVVRAGEAPEKVMGECKAWCTRRLREAGLVTPEQKVWARHGSTRYLFHEEEVRGAVRYVLDEQGQTLG